MILAKTLIECITNTRNNENFGKKFQRCNIFGQKHRKTVSLSFLVVFSVKKTFFQQFPSSIGSQFRSNPTNFMLFETTITHLHLSKIFPISLTIHFLCDYNVFQSIKCCLCSRNNKYAFPFWPAINMPKVKDYRIPSPWSIKPFTNFVWFKLWLPLKYKPIIAQWCVR